MVIIVWPYWQNSAGCGLWRGILSGSFGPLGAQVTGIDADPATIATATAHARQSFTALCGHRFVRRSSHRHLILVCMEMLEHVHHPELVIKHCAQHLKPGGLLLLSTINRTPQVYFGAIVMAEYVLNPLPKQTHTYENAFAPASLVIWHDKPAF